MQRCATATSAHLTLQWDASTSVTIEVCACVRPVAQLVRAQTGTRETWAPACEARAQTWSTTFSLLSGGWWGVQLLCSEQFVCYQTKNREREKKKSNQNWFGCVAIFLCALKLESLENLDCRDWQKKNRTTPKTAKTIQDLATNNFILITCFCFIERSRQSSSSTHLQTSHGIIQIISCSFF